MVEHGSADVLVVGAGVLGVSVAYWLSSNYDCTIALADLSQSAGMHTSSRNTGVIHRPFYLDPRKKRVFAQASLVSRPLWEGLAKDAGLPWKPVGTYNVALDETEVRTLEQYRRWGVENGMKESEMELLDGRGVRSQEPQVSCRAGLLSRTDVSVDFGAFTRRIWNVISARGVRFLGGNEVVSIEKEGDKVLAGIRAGSGLTAVRCRFLINAAGGGALRIAHRFGLAEEYSVLHFRGEYWVVDEPFASQVSTNIYRPPKFPKYPFLDPHFVVRADGSRQIGPNAVVVPGPYVYSGVGLSRFPSFLERPVEPKVKLFSNRDFVSLVMGEWRSSLSKDAMCGRVRKFVPALRTSMLNKRAIFGVRSSIVGISGFVPEALLFKGEDSAHIINFNSPGATGAPAYSAKVIDELQSGGHLDMLVKKTETHAIPGWYFQAVASQM